MVEFSCFISVAPGSLARILGMDLSTLIIGPCCGCIPHTKLRKIGTDVISGAVFLKQKKKGEEDWQQMLAQGQTLSHIHKKRDTRIISKIVYFVV